METCFNYCDKETAYFSSDEKKWINRMRKLAAKYPDKVTILAQPETNDGCIYVKLPSRALRVQIPSKGTPLTEEQKQKLAEGYAKKKLRLQA